MHTLISMNPHGMLGLSLSAVDFEEIIAFIAEGYQARSKRRGVAEEGGDRHRQTQRKS